MYCLLINHRDIIKYLIKYLDNNKKYLYVCNDLIRVKHKNLLYMKNKNIYPWVVVGLLWIVALLNYMDRQMLSTMQEAMKVDIVELNKAEAFGALMAIFLWIYGFMSPVAGIIADRVNRKWLVVGSLFVWSAVTFLMGYAQDFHELYWLRAIMGISEALYIPSALFVDC